MGGLNIDTKHNSKIFKRQKCIFLTNYIVFSFRENQMDSEAVSYQETCFYERCEVVCSAPQTSRRLLGGDSEKAALAPSSLPLAECLRAMPVTLTDSTDLNVTGQLPDMNVCTCEKVIRYMYVNYFRQ